MHQNNLYAAGLSYDIGNRVNETRNTRHEYFDWQTNWGFFLLRKKCYYFHSGSFQSIHDERDIGRLS